MHIDPITGPDLVKTLTKVKPSSPGLDAWKPESLVALSRWLLSIYDGLALLLNWVGNIPNGLHHYTLPTLH